MRDHFVIINKTVFQLRLNSHAEQLLIPTTFLQLKALLSRKIDAKVLQYLEIHVEGF